MGPGLVYSRASRSTWQGRPERDKAWVAENAHLEGVKKRPVFRAKVPKLIDAGWPATIPSDGSPSSLEVNLITAYSTGCVNTALRA